MTAVPIAAVSKQMTLIWNRRKPTSPLQHGSAMTRLTPPDSRTPQPAPRLSDRARNRTGHERGGQCARRSRRRSLCFRPLYGIVSQGNPGRVVDPGLLRLGVAATRLALLDHAAARLVQASVDLVQFVLVLDLDAEVIEARRAPARRDRKIDARIVQHPFGVIGLHDGGLSRKQRRIEADGAREIIDGDVDMHALHVGLLLGRGLAAPGAGRFTGRRGCADLVRTAAAVIREIGEQRIHGVEVRRVDHRAAVTANRDETGIAQPVEMERQRVRREFKCVGNAAGGQALGPASTSRRNTSRRLSWARAAKAATASCFFIFQQILK